MWKRKRNLCMLILFYDLCLKCAFSRRFGPLPKFPHQRVWSRGIVIVGVLVYVWFTSGGKETTLAKFKDVLPHRGQKVDCDDAYLEEIKQYAGCVPVHCGRYVSDKLVTANEAEVLLNIAKKGNLFVLKLTCN